MDYCHQCRRHLNGALACAGCGTPVEELRHHSPSVPAPDHVLELDEVSAPAGHRRSRRQTPPRPRPAGRRARKKRGRKVLIGTVGLVLAAGALSLAELAFENPGDDGAATSVKEEDAVETLPVPEPTESETPERPEGVTEKPIVATSSAARPTVTGTRPGKAEAGGGSTATGAGPGSGGGSPTASSSADEPSGPADPSASEPPNEPGGPGSQQPPAQPAPSPTPSPPETCDRFLWWCL